jgi:hypothetical protein
MGICENPLVSICVFLGQVFSVRRDQTDCLILPFSGAIWAGNHEIKLSKSNSRALQMFILLQSEQKLADCVGLAI